MSVPLRRGLPVLIAPLALLGITAPADSAPLAGAVPPGTPVSWQADLSKLNKDDVNVVHDGRALKLRSTTTGPASLRNAEASGQLTLAPRDLATPTNRVQAKVDGAPGAAVDVRAYLGGTRWTEWAPAGSVLPKASRRLQVRLVLTTRYGTASPSVTALRLSADQTSQPSPYPELAPLAAPGRTYKVFATREGLVGGLTANGHTIQSRDHFVALPSRRGLAPKNAGDYSVRVCTTDGARCEYAPVWDVGPWNVKDDYWNPASVREMWKDLPQGKPEAQAAKLEGYNGGKDGWGRTVLNPAGIDLADGTFWDGLKLSDNAWVNVTYLWTGTGAKGVVRTSGRGLNVRSAPKTGASVKGYAAKYANVKIECHVRGDKVTGYYGTSNLWNRVGPAHYIPDVYLYTGSDDPVAPAC